MIIVGHSEISMLDNGSLCQQQYEILENVMFPCKIICKGYGIV